MINEQLAKGMKHIMDRAGLRIRLNYYNQSIGSVYDDESILTYSGTTWTSGIVMSVNSSFGGNDGILMEQGILRDSDKKLFISGNYPLTGSSMQVKIQLGPNGENYSVLHLGKFGENVIPEVSGNIVYKKVYIRRLTNGSLWGEV
jgi:hypothetical protein